MADKPKDRLFTVDEGSIVGDFGPPEPISMEELVRKGSEAGVPIADQTNSDKNFWVAITTYGGAFATGLYLLGDNPSFSRSWWYGVVYTIGGGLGLVSVTPLFRPHFGVMRSQKSLWAVVIVTWLFLAANIGFSVYEKFAAHSSQPIENVARPASALIPSAPASPPQTRDVPPLISGNSTENRIYSTKKVLDFVPAQAGITDLQAQMLSADEKGKWMKVDGVIRNIAPDMVLTLAPNEGGQVRCVFNQKWASKLAMLRQGDKLRLDGKIREYFSGDLTLEECEIL